MKLKKILIFNPYLAPYRLDLFNKLSETFEVYVLLTGNKKEINAQGFDIKKVNSEAKFKFDYFDRGFYLGRHLISLIYLKYIYKHRPAIVFAHELGFNSIISIVFKAVFKYKLVITIDDSLKMVKEYSKLRSLLRKLVYKFADELVVVNPNVQEYLSLLFPKEKSKFLYFPIIQDDCVLLSKIITSEPNYLIEKFDLFDHKVILFVGRLEPVKSPMLLLEGFKKLIETYSNVKLIMVGEGSLKSSLSTYIKEHNLDEFVKLPGKLSGNELYSYYNLAQIFVLPSNFEPFGAVVNEALVAGCYSIVSNVAGSAALIDERNGSLFESENFDDLYSKMEHALKFVPIQKEIKSMMQKSFELYYGELLLHL